MKKILCLLFLLPFFALAQNNKNHITHKVGPKESFTSIGRLYSINGRELANFNNLDYNKGLTLGQVLKIPEKNVTVDVPVTLPPAKVELPEKTVVAKNEKGATIFHTVGKKETLYHISTLYNKVPIADLKKWNNLTSDALKEGTSLIVGYSKTKAGVKENDSKAVIDKKNVVENKPVIKPVKEKEIPVVNKEEKPIEKIEDKTIQVPEVRKAKNFKGGLFKNDFDKQTHDAAVKEETGGAGIFKSTSGWQDGKYYCLHNTAASGTIIKITSTTTGKSVYAKVLDIIPDISQNNGLIIRLSNAAAAELGVSENKFDCSLSYSK